MLQWSYTVSRISKFGKQAVALLLGGLVADSALAAGYALNESSVSAAGTAYAGRGSYVQDASIMVSNPAGIAFLDGAQISGGINLIVPNGNYHNGDGRDVDGAALTGDTDGSFTFPKFVPLGYYSRPVNDRLTVGFGIHVPFAAETEYEDDSVARALALKTSVTVIQFQPTIAWQLSDSLSLGFGLPISYIDGQLTRSLDTEDGSNMGKSSIAGDNWSAGWQLGFLWQSSESTRIGVSYTSKINHTLEGSVEVKNVAGAIYKNAKVDGEVKIILPEKLEISLAKDMSDRLTLLAGAAWTRWSRFDELKGIVKEEFDASFQPPIQAGGVAVYIPEEWRDAWAWSLGSAYQYNKEWKFKAGYAFDKTPVRTLHRTARIPDVNRQWLTIGASFNPSSDYTIDFACGHMFKKRVYIDDKLNGTVSSESYKSKTYVSADIFAVSITKHL